MYIYREREACVARCTVDGRSMVLVVACVRVGFAVIYEHGVFTTTVTVFWFGQFVL